MSLVSIIKATLVAGFVITTAASPVASLNKDLKPLLSPNAAIWYPGSTGYANATNRWSADTNPGLDVVVMVKGEKDVQATIKYANAHSIPFLAINGGHGTSSYLNNIKSGIGIYMRGLKGVSLNPLNSSQAVVLGGTISAEAVSGFASFKKQSTAGGCDCTGFTSPMLGGGHGWLQGRYGLMTDNLVSARVVLANGTAISVDATQHSELYWGLRGAGHNFGIVTSVNYQVYDTTPENDGFATATFTFTQDKLEAVFTIANRWLAAKHRPIELTHYAIITNNPTVDTKPIILFLVYWQGPGPIPSQYIQPLNALKPVSVAKTHVDLLGANANTGASLDGPACAHGNGRQSFPVDLDTWDLANLRSVLNIFATFATSPLKNSVMLLEGFATNRVLEIDPASTAYASRESQLLASPLLTYPAGNATLDAEVAVTGKQIRAALVKGSEGGQLRAYVNYANGDESQESVYGYEKWRLERLRALKRSYDPNGRFNFYEPIKI